MSESMTVRMAGLGDLSLRVAAEASGLAGLSVR